MTQPRSGKPYIPRGGRTPAGTWVHIHAGEKILLATKRGISIIDEVKNALKVVLQEQFEKVIGRVILADTKGEELPLIQTLKEGLRAMKSFFTVMSPTMVSYSVTKNLIASGSVHDAGDMLNDSLAGAWEFKNMAAQKGGSLYITEARVSTEVESQTWRPALLLFSQKPTAAMTDNAPGASPSAEDEPFFQDEIVPPALHSRGDGSYTVATASTVGNLPKKFTCAPNSRSIFVIVIAIEATSQTAGEKLTVELSGERLKTARK